MTCSKLILFVLAATFLSSSHAQKSTRADSLLNELNQAKEDTNQVNILIGLSAFYLHVEVDKSLEYATEAGALSERLNYDRGIIRSLRYTGLNHLERNDFSTAKAYYEKGLQLSKEKGFGDLSVKFLNNLGVLLSINREYEEAKKAFLEVLDIGDLDAKSSACNNLAIGYKSQGKYQLALSFYFKALHYQDSVESIRTYSSAVILNNIANIYLDQKEYEKSHEYFAQALAINRSVANKRGMAQVLFGMGVTYSEERSNETALAYLDSSRTLALELNDFKRIARNNREIAEVFINEDKPDTALVLLREGVEIINNKDGSQVLKATIHYYIAEASLMKGLLNTAEEYINYSTAVFKVKKEKELLREAYELSSEIQASKGDYKGALAEYRKMYLLQDSLERDKYAQKVAEIGTIYETQEKEQKIKEQKQAIAILSRESEIAFLWRNLLIVIIILLVFGSFFIYYLFRSRNKRKQLLLESQETINENLRQLSEIKSRFFTNISHEFRTPITLIKGPIDDMLRNGEEKLPRAKAEMIHRHADYLQRLVNQLLDLSRLDAGSLVLEPGNGDLYAFLRALGSAFHSHAREHKITYILSIPKGSLDASFDQDKLEKIIYNLLSNAFKHAEEIVKFHAVWEDGKLCIHVSDDGKGIPEAEIEKIFDRFYQIDISETREHEGTGIGLALTKELVELMKGEIHVKSVSGKDTTFSIALTIPTIDEPTIIEEMTPPLAIPEKESIPEGYPSNSEKPLVLLVEDNGDMRQYISEHLNDHYRIIEAADGQAGLDAALKEVPDLIITDLMMPKLDGTILCERLKHDERTSHIPIVMLTAKADQKNKIKGLKTGADDYLVKPFDQQELLARVDNLIKQRAQLRERFGRQINQEPRRFTVSSIDEKFLEKMIEQIERNISNASFSVPELQESLLMSKAQLHRKVKALTNYAPGEFIRNYRLKRAAQIIEQKGDNITQVAYSVGFNSMSYFAKCFRELYGVRPSEFIQAKSSTRS